LQSTKETSSASDQEGVLVFGADLPPSHTDIVPSQMGYEEEESADEPDLREIGTRLLRNGVQTSLKSNTLKYNSVIRQFSFF